MNELISAHTRMKIMCHAAGSSRKFLNQFRWERESEGKGRYSYWFSPDYIQFWKEVSVILSRTLKENK
jgi:hypothetical protein